MEVFNFGDTMVHLLDDTVTCDGNGGDISGGCRECVQRRVNGGLSFIVFRRGVWAETITIEDAKRRIEVSFNFIRLYWTTSALVVKSTARLSTRVSSEEHSWMHAKLWDRCKLDVWGWHTMFVIQTWNGSFQIGVESGNDKGRPFRCKLTAFWFFYH